MAGSVFKRCTKCGNRMPERPCRKCGGERVRWAFTVDVAAGQRGRRKQQLRSGFETKKEAERALRDLLTSIDQGRYIEPNTLTVERYLLEHWLPARKPKQRDAGRRHRGQVSLGTWSSYRSDLNAHVIPRIGSTPLQELTPADLNRLYDELEESGGRKRKGLAPKTICNIHGIIHKALSDAVKKGYVPRNVADAVDAPRARKAKTQIWTVEQLREFLQHVQAQRLYAGWLLFATTGMRRGEVAGLCWEDVDLDAATVRIEWTLGVVDAKATWKRRAKSDAGERIMSLDPATLEALRAYRAVQGEERLRLGPGWPRRQHDWQGDHRDDLVFTWPDGSLIHPERWSTWFALHCQNAGLPIIRLHDVRHTYATAAITNARGWHDIKVISKRLGHASIGITLDTYAHVLPSADQETAHSLATLILGTA
jgi:integrase